MNRVTLVCGAGLLILVGFSPLIGAITATGAGTMSSGTFEDWRVQLDSIETKLDEPELSDDELPILREKIDTLLLEMEASVAADAPELKAVAAELESLGEPPTEGDVPEAGPVKSLRKELEDRLAEINGRTKETQLFINNTNTVLEKLVKIRRTRFANKVLARGPSPFSPSLWKNAIPQIIAASVSVKSATRNVVISQKLHEQLKDSALAISVAFVVAVVLVWPLHYWLLQRYGWDPKISKPSFMQATRATLVVGTVRAFLPTAAAALIYVVLINRGLLSDAGKEIAGALFFGFMFFIWVLAFFRASLSPAQPAWRVLPVPDNFARGIWQYIILLALIYAIDIVLSEVITIYGARLEITVLRDYGIAVLVLFLLVALLLKQAMWTPDDVADANPKWQTPRVMLAALLALFPVLGGFGFVALTRYVATQVLLTGGLVFLLLVLHRFGRELVEQSISTDTWLGERLRISLRMDEESANRFRFWTGIAFNLCLIIFGLIMGLFVWGANRQDVAGWIHQALFGFKIGQISISLVDITVAALVVVTLIFLTRYIQRVLATQVLPQTSFDSGIRESIRIATGYIGIIIAAAAGIAAIGLDLSSFALIAGALTVGVGFGLQNIVNNFVSGLILLVERPIKIGDWIVVGDRQGYVKNIKVRATEIQTFERASIFIPNAELISGVVMNWTHADKIGRIIIPIGVAYRSDTKKIREVLTEIGKSHPQVLSDPEPAVVFRGFGDSALNFELRCFLGDIEKTILVTSDLCYAIDEAFRREGIEIPFPQRDVYIKHMPTLDQPAKES